MTYNRQLKAFDMTADEKDSIIDIVLSIDDVLVQKYPTTAEISNYIIPYIKEQSTIKFLFWLVYAGPVVTNDQRTSYERLKDLLAKNIHVIEEPADN